MSIAAWVVLLCILFLLLKFRKHRLMTINCRFCGAGFSSFALPSQAEKEVLEAVARHITGTHPDKARSLGQLVSLASTYFLINECVTIPPDERAFKRIFQENEAVLLEVMGVSPPAD